MSRTSGPVIDLGVYASDQDVDPEPGGGEGGWWWPEWQRLRRLPGRRWLVGLLVPLLLATVDTVPPRPALVPLWEAGGLLVASETTAYGMEQAGGGATVTAYRLADGSVRWEQRLPGDTWSAPRLFGDVLLSVRVAPGNRSVVAIDAATGQMRWSVDRGYPLVLGDEWVLLVGPEAMADSGTEGLPGGGGAPYEVTLRDIRTGETAWTGWFAPNEVPLYGVTEHLLTVQPSGRLTRYDPATGSVLAVAETAPVPQVEGGGSGQRLVAMPDGTVVSLGGAQPVATVVDDLVVVTDRSGTVAYEAATLRRRWRADPADRVAACGAVVCGYRDVAGTVRAVDPVTGAVRWSRSCDQGLEIDRSPGTTCFLTPVELTEAVLQRVIFGDDGGPTYSLLTVDETTGALHGVLTGWLPTGLRDGDQVLVSSDYLTAMGTADPRVWLAWWRAEPHALEVLGSVDAEWCSHLSGRYLYCGRWEDTGQPVEVRVWRVG